MAGPRKVPLSFLTIPRPTVSPDDYSLGDDFCMRLSGDWFSVIQGLMVIMKYRRMWDAMDDAEWFELQDWLEVFFAMSCECGMTDVRVSSAGKLQRFIHGQWVDAAGDGGDVTVVNNLETMVNNYYEIPEPDETIDITDRACGIASGFVNWLFDRMLDTLDIVDATSNTVASLDGFLVLFLPLYIVVDQVTDALKEFESAGTGAIRAADTQPQREKTICAVYDWLIPRNGNVRPEDADNLRGIIIDSFSNATMQGIWALYLALFTETGFAHRAMIYQADPGGICGGLCGGEGCTIFDQPGVAGWNVSLGVYAQNLCDGMNGVSNPGAGGELLLIWTSQGGKPKLINSVHTKDTHALATGTVVYRLMNNGATVSDIRSVSGSLGSASCAAVNYDNINLVADEIRFYANSPLKYELSNLEICWTDVWQVTFDFATASYQDDWELRPGDTWGTYQAGVGWNAALTTSGEQRVLQLRTKQSVDSMSAIEWTIENWLSGAAACELLNSLVNAVTLTTIADKPDANGVYSHNVNGGLQPLLVLRPGCANSPPDPGGTATLRKVVISGTGDYPFFKAPD